jgi:hypothetical protein
MKYLKILIILSSISVFSCSEEPPKKEEKNKKEFSILDHMSEEKRDRIEKRRKEREENGDFF